MFVDTGEDEVIDQENQPPPHPAKVVLRRPGYYTIPTLGDLAQLTDADGNCFVDDFSVGRERYGSVFFPGMTNVKGLNLDEIGKLIYFLIVCVHRQTHYLNGMIVLCSIHSPPIWLYSLKACEIILLDDDKLFKIIECSHLVLISYDFTSFVMITFNFILPLACYVLTKAQFIFR